LASLLFLFRDMAIFTSYPWFHRTIKSGEGTDGRIEATKCRNPEPKSRISASFPSPGKGLVGLHGGDTCVSC
jgi:hypothetical protein